MRSPPASRYDPSSPAVQADPYPYYEAMRRDEPVAYVDSLDAYAVSRYDDVRRVMHDHEAFSSEAMATLVARPADYANDASGEAGADRAAPISIVGTDGETHHRLRLIVNRGFTPRRMALLEARMRATAGSLIDRLLDDTGGDLQSGLAVPFPTIVIAELLGVAAEQRDDFRRWSEHMVQGVFEPPSEVDRAQIADSGRHLDDWLDSVIAARHGADGDDLVSVLLRAELEGGALTHDELRVFVVTLLVAGSITTAYLIGNAVSEILGDRSLEARVRADPAMTARIVEESLRHETPTQMMFRTATTAVDIGGTTIPARSTVVALLGSANRDPRVFPDPDRFDPDRDASPHLAFGHGVHFCLGAALARLEATSAISELMARAPELELAGPAERVTSLVFRGPTTVPLRIGPSPGKP